MQLIYRGQVLDYDSLSTQPYRKPRALNWRYQIPGETYENKSIPPSSHRQFRGINWRYQMIAKS